MRFFFLLSLFSTTLIANNYKFKYQTHDGTINDSCTHERLNEWYDWKVVCGQREFSVHLSLRKIHRDTIPQTRIELLYWISQHHSGERSEGSSSSIWFHLTRQTDIFKVTARQSTDKDTAALYLEVF